jgi:hypothetical protein
VTNPVQAPVVLHVGFHKTGTTTLQGQFFPALPGTRVLGPRNPGFDEFHTAARRLCLDADERDAHEWLDRRIAALRAECDTLVVSLEDFTYWHQHGRTARRLHALVPHARVLVCVRDQRTLLFSRYVGWINKGGSAGLRRFLADLDPAWLEFDAAVGRYQELFGATRVKVLPYELLRERPDRFLADVRAFVVPGAAPPAREIDLGVENQSLAPPTRTLVRTVNRLRPSSDEPRDPLAPLPQRRFNLALQRWDARLLPTMRRGPGRRATAALDVYADRYAAGNAQLERLTGLSLARYGYVLPPVSTPRA